MTITKGVNFQEENSAKDLFEDSFDDGGVWIDCRFIDCELSGANIYDSIFENCVFERTCLYWCSIFMTKFINCRFFNCDLRGSFTEVRFEKCHFLNNEVGDNNLGGLHRMGKDNFGRNRS